MIDLGPEQLATVRRLLAAHMPECEARVFGSRINGRSKSYSDLDIVLVGQSRLPLARLAALREALAESNLSIRVDVLDWHAVSEGFRTVIAAEFEVLQKPVIAVSEPAKPEL